MPVVVLKMEGPYVKAFKGQLLVAERSPQLTAS